MRIKSLKLTKFRRFEDLQIEGLSPTARLVVLTGPNGHGKSSIFDALNLWFQAHTTHGLHGNTGAYYNRDNESQPDANRAVVEFYGPQPKDPRTAFTFRSAFRNDPSFKLDSLTAQGDIAGNFNLRRMIDGDATVTGNYSRLASQSLQEVFSKGPPETTFKDFRKSVLGDIRKAMLAIFGDINLNDLGDPLAVGTFKFSKGTSEAYDYQNLSAGEKSAFDLILDIVVKRATFTDTVYCIDEPEAHLNANVQAKLLEQLLLLLPDECQLWIATHSIGMMKKARDIAINQPGTVDFIDFTGLDLDQAVKLKPVAPTRAFWEKVLHVAVDDLAKLVAPEQVIICEGTPAPMAPTSKNPDHDATCYDIIFGNEFPGTKFVSGTSSNAVVKDTLGIAAMLPQVAKGIQVRRLIDRDDHNATEIAAYKAQGISVLSLRHIEAYLYHDEVLTALCEAEGKPEIVQPLLDAKAQAIAKIVQQSKPADDIKSAAGMIYTDAKKLLSLPGTGNSHQAFAIEKLVPLITPKLPIYSQLKLDVFGT